MADDDTGTLGPFGAMLARAELADVSERRAVHAAAATDGPTNVEVARLICRVLDLAAERLDIPCDLRHGDLHEICCQLIAAARRTGVLTPFEYRLAWWLSSESHRFPF